MTTYWQNWSLEAQRLMQHRNDEWRARFGVTQEPYTWDLGSALLTFRRKNAALVADLTLVGTLSDTQGSFLWSWANNDLPDRATIRIGRVREFGTDHDLPLLIDAEIHADHAQALELAIVAGRVLDAQGLFIDRCDDLTLYFLLFNFRLTGDLTDGVPV